MAKTREQKEERRKARRNRKRLCVGITCGIAIGFAIGLNWDAIRPKVKEYSSKALDKGKDVLEEKVAMAKAEELKDYADKLLVLSSKCAEKAKEIAKQLKSV